ncbi:MAG: hypothetical protein ACR2OE_03660 [Thermomicrobiales bacterium]
MGDIGRVARPIVVPHPDAKYYGLARTGGGEGQSSSTGEVVGSAAD